MSEISPRPWKVEHARDALDTYRRIIVDAKGQEIVIMRAKDFCDYATCMPDAEHIVKCVNEHDSLVFEIDSLTKGNEELVAEIERLNEKLNELSTLNLRANINMDSLRKSLKFVKEMYCKKCGHRNCHLCVIEAQEILSGGR